MSWLNLPGWKPYTLGKPLIFSNIFYDLVSDLPVEEGYEMMKKCVKEVQKRLVINLPNFKVQLVDKDGIKDLPPITSKSLLTVQ